MGILSIRDEREGEAVACEDLIERDLRLFEGDLASATVSDELAALTDEMYLFLRVW